MGGINLAIQLAADSAEPFARKPSPWWYDRDHLALNMLSAIGSEFTLAAFVSQLDRCTSREIGQSITERFGKGRLCRDVSQTEAGDLLEILRRHVPAQITAKQLGPMGREAWKHEELIDGYACEEGALKGGSSEPCAQIPFLVEVWAATCETRINGAGDGIYSMDVIGFTINRSPAIVRSTSSREGRSKNASLTLGDVYCRLTVPQGAFQFAINITSPVRSDR